jgi:hypothetical protein
MFILGLLYGRTLHSVFGMLGIAISIGMLRYCLNATPKPKQWLVEHLGAMLGSAIGAYTAFFAFGGRSLFSDLGNAQLLFWIAPGVIGGTAIFLLSRKYQPRQRNTLE